MQDTTNHTPRRTYRLPRATIDALGQIVARGGASNETGAVIAAVAHYAVTLGIDLAPPARKPRKKSAATS